MAIHDKLTVVDVPSNPNEAPEPEAPAREAALAALADGATVRPLARVRPERVSWLWPGYLPAGKLVVLDGDPSTGKSTVTDDLAARCSTGSPWPDGAASTGPRGVVLLSAEDGLADTIAPRLTAAGADMARIFALTEVAVGADDERRMVPPSLPRDIHTLGRVIEATDAALVVIDVLMAYLGASTDSHRDQDVRGVLHQLAAMADRTGACIVLIRHLNKSGAGSPLYRGGGSIGIVGAARAAFLVGRDPADDDRRILACLKSNLAAEPASLAYRLVNAEPWGCARVEWEPGPVAGMTAAHLLAAPSDDDERTEQDEAIEWLSDYLEARGNQAPAADVLRDALRVGIAKTTLHRARKRAGVESVKGGFGAGWTWRLGGRRFHEDSQDSSAQETEPWESSVPSEESSRPSRGGSGDVGVGETPSQGTLYGTSEDRCSTHGTPVSARVGCPRCAAERSGGQS